MVLDDVLVVTAELEGMRRLARLPRPKVRVVQEDLPGASCIWSQSETAGGHRDLIRLRPRSGVPLVDTLRAIRLSSKRVPDGHMELRGTRASFLEEDDLLQRLGGRENLSLPRALMARSLEELSTPVGLEVTVARDEESLARLRSVVGQVFADKSATEAEQADVEADFFHAPGVMTYLAVNEGGRTISTGSLLIVDGVANVWSVATIPSARGQGAATAIMATLCDEARNQGASAAVLRTTDELASPGALYDRVGFAAVGHERIWELDGVDHLDLA